MLWIGTRTIILKGVTICEGAIIGTGSIVIKDMLPYSINVGCPAKPIKCRFNRDELNTHLKLVKSNYTLEKISNLYYKKIIQYN